ncbi:hypothetical protein Leryth_005683 [Lithospermum erythrorhizon]|nr:hypothetical protein Leryth_005683 [Lithospermum erythrorhizon]
MNTQMHNFGFVSVPSGDLGAQNFEDQSKRVMLTNSMILGQNNDVVDEDDGAVSDSESSSGSCCSSVGNPKKIVTFDDGLIRVEEGNKEYDTIRLSIVAGLSSSGLQAQINDVNRVDYSGFRKSAKLQAFEIFVNAVEKSCGGDANVKYAWYGASKNEIMKIVSHGFCDPPNNGMFGRGLYLSPVEHILDSLQSTVVDGDGARYLLLCRVLMGRMEQIPAGSKQSYHSYPSSKDFDSGVDYLANPRKYIVWGTHMNSHILPKYVISIGDVNNTQVARPQRVSVTLRKPNSPWLPFPTLISELARFLQPHSLDLIKKYHNEHRMRKLTRFELIQRVRHIAGDELLASVIKSYRQKQLKVSHLAMLQTRGWRGEEKTVPAGEEIECCSKWKK